MNTDIQLVDTSALANLTGLPMIYTPYRTLSEIINTHIWHFIDEKAIADTNLRLTLVL